jgi:hypothetical protein
VEATAGGHHTPASPIGLYFARLWYAEALYPVIFAAHALAKTRGQTLPTRLRRNTLLPS